MTRVRPVKSDDLEAILQVGLRNGLSPFDPSALQKSWESHPFRTEFEGVPHGWVLEDSRGRIVGTFSNVHMMYELEGRKVKAGTAGSWAVDLEHRSASLLLAMAYFGQTGLDVLLNGSASAVASQIMPRLKAERIPSPGYDKSLFWITNRVKFTEAALRKKNVPAAGMLARLAAGGLWALDGVRRLPCQWPPEARRPRSFGPEFDEFWERIRCGPNRLRAVRTAAALEWRFGRSLQTGRASLITLGTGASLRGYAVLLRRTRAHLNLSQYLIGDLQALEDSPETTRALLSAALAATQEDGLDALEWQGWNSAKRRVAESLHPWSYGYAVWPLFYRTRDPDLARTLNQARVWDFSPFDAF